MPSLLRTRPGARAASSESLHGEAELVGRAKQDRRAFAALYDRYFPTVYGYCSHRLESREAAEDATSLVFAKALAALPNQRGPSFRGWLFGIAHHVVADALAAKRSDLPLDVALKVWDRAPSPEGAALASETHRVLSAALAQLSLEQRQVVELRLAGLTSVEMGRRWAAAAVRSTSPSIGP